MGKSSGGGGGGAVGATATGYAVDTSGMQQAYTEAARIVQNAYPRALAQYTTAAEVGLSNYLNYQGQANQVLVPYSDASKAAVGDLRYFLGLTPLSASAGAASALRSAAGQAAIGTGASFYGGDFAGLTELAGQLDRAENLTDPAQRAAAKANIMKFSTSLQERIRGEMEQNQAGLEESLKGTSETSREIATNTFQQQQNQLNQLLVGTDQAVNTFKAGYTDEPGKAATGEEIRAKLENTPQYQFQLQQGTQAMERTQAAKGTLQSGNALIEAQQFGQGLAESAFATHIQQVSGLLGQTMPAAQAQAQNISNTGQSVLQTQYNMAQTRQNSIQDQAKLEYSNQQQLGQGLLQGAISTAGNQTQASIATANNMTQASVANANIGAQQAGAQQQGTGQVVGMLGRYALGAATGGGGGLLSKLFV